MTRTTPMTAEAMPAADTSSTASTRKATPIAVEAAPYIVDNSLLRELHAERNRRTGRELVHAMAIDLVRPYNVRPLLILDLDGTLLVSTPRDMGGKMPGKPSFVTSFSSMDVQETRLRPGLVSFLEAVRPHFDLAVFTAATLEYAETMVEGINSVCPGFRDSLCCFWTREHTCCLWSLSGRLTVLKELRRLAQHCGRPLSRCLIVDDTPETYALNVSNALPIPAYAGGEMDGALKRLSGFLLAMPTMGVPLDVSGYELAPPGAKALLAEVVDGHVLGGQENAQ